LGSHLCWVTELASGPRAASAPGICPVVGAVPMQLREAEDDQSGWRTLSTSRHDTAATDGLEWRTIAFVSNQSLRAAEAVALGQLRVLVYPVLVMLHAVVNRRALAR